MKIKMVGFKVGKSRPVANITIDLLDLGISGNLTRANYSSFPYIKEAIGEKLLEVLEKSDFVSIRRIDGEVSKNEKAM